MGIVKMMLYRKLRMTVTLGNEDIMADVHQGIKIGASSYSQLAGQRVDG